MIIFCFFLCWVQNLWICYSIKWQKPVERRILESKILNGMNDIITWTWPRWEPEQCPTTVWASCCSDEHRALCPLFGKCFSLPPSICCLVHLFFPSLRCRPPHPPTLSPYLPIVSVFSRFVGLHFLMVISGGPRHLWPGCCSAPLVKY